VAVLSPIVETTRRGLAANFQVRDSATGAGRTVTRRIFVRRAGLLIGAVAGLLGAGVARTERVQAAPGRLASGRLTVWGWPTGIILAVVDESGKDVLVETFKADTGIELELVKYDYKDYPPALKTALPAGTGPDAVLTDWDAMGPLWDFLMPLDEMAVKEWGDNWNEQFTEPATSEMALVDAQNARYLPGNMQLLGWPLYWIEDFQKAGIDAASLKTWADMEAAVGKLKLAGLQPFLGSGANWQIVDWFQSLVEVSAPGKIEEVQRGSGKFTDPDMVEAFKLHAKVHNEWMQSGVAGAEAAVPIDGFSAQHACAMVMAAAGTPWFNFLGSDNPTIREAINNRWGTFLLPQSKGLAATDAGVAIVKGTKNQDAAWEYVKWTTTGHGAELIAKNTAQPMGFKKIQPGKRGTPFDRNLAEPLFAALQHPTANKFRRILAPEVYQALADTLPGVITAQITAEEAAAEVQEALEKSFQGAGQKWLRRS